MRRVTPLSVKLPKWDGSHIKTIETTTCVHKRKPSDFIFVCIKSEQTTHSVFTRKSSTCDCGLGYMCPELTVFNQSEADDAQTPAPPFIRHWCSSLQLINSVNRSAQMTRQLVWVVSWVVICSANPGVSDVLHFRSGNKGLLFIWKTLVRFHHLTSAHHRLSAKSQQTHFRPPSTRRH